jgi:hypothetical protein
MGMRSSFINSSASVAESTSSACRAEVRAAPVVRTRDGSNCCNWGQIPIQDSVRSVARGDERNWALAPIAGPTPTTPRARISFASGHKLIGVRVQFRTAFLLAIQTLVLNWKLTPINCFGRCGNSSLADHWRQFA